jgi:protein gp37
MARRLHAMGQANYRNGFRVTLHPHALDLPKTWKSPRTIFVNSMSDLFHEKVPTAFIKKVFGVMVKAKWHRFQVLTKRSERLVELSATLPWACNIWMGVTVENENVSVRINHLRKTSASVKFLSVEPLLGPLPALELTDIDWVIVGGESGPGARFMDPEWVIDIRDQCVRAGVPFFFKQWGGTDKKRAGRILEGRTWDDMPAVLG